MERRFRGTADVVAAMERRFRGTADLAAAMERKLRGTAYVLAAMELRLHVGLRSSGSAAAMPWLGDVAAMWLRASWRDVVAAI
jgi:hypothetical protein